MTADRHGDAFTTEKAAAIFALHFDCEVRLQSIKTFEASPPWVALPSPWPPGCGQYWPPAVDDLPDFAAFAR